MKQTHTHTPWCIPRCQRLWVTKILCIPLHWVTHTHTHTPVRASAHTHGGVWKPPVAALQSSLCGTLEGLRPRNNSLWDKAQCAACWPPAVSQSTPRRYSWRSLPCWLNSLPPLLLHPSVLLASKYKPENSSLTSWYRILWVKAADIVFHWLPQMTSVPMLEAAFRKLDSYQKYALSSFKISILDL